MTKPKYRFRTMLRSNLPAHIAERIPKGAADCGDHEWYLAEAGTWRCYHCAVGVTHELPWDEREYEARQLEADAMRVRAGLDVQERLPLVHHR